MRVLMVANRWVRGGAETTALGLVRRLEGPDCHFVVAALKAGGELRSALAATGATVVEGLSRRRFDPLATFRVARLARRHAVDAVVIVDVPRNTLFHGLLGAALGRRSAPRLCWCNSRPDGQSGNFLRQLRTYFRLRLLDAVLCTSRLQRTMLAEGGLPRRRMPLLRNSVDTAGLAAAAPARLDLPAGKRAIIQIANVMPDKDFDTLLAAAGLLARLRDDWRLLLVGHGTDSADLAARADRAGAAGFVVGLGPRDDVPALLRAAELFVLSTHREVFSVATIEAMAAGLPVVVSDIATFRELFQDGREGLRVPPENPQALAEAIHRLLGNADLARSISRASRARAQRFGVDRMAASFLRLIRRIAPRPH